MLSSEADVDVNDSRGRTYIRLTPLARTPLMLTFLSSPCLGCSDLFRDFSAEADASPPPSLSLSFDWQLLSPPPSLSVSFDWDASQYSLLQLLNSQHLCPVFNVGYAKRLTLNTASWRPSVHSFYAIICLCGPKSSGLEIFPAVFFCGRSSTASLKGCTIVSLAGKKYVIHCPITSDWFDLSTVLSASQKKQWSFLQCSYIQKLLLRRVGHSI